jgi:predicted RNase H-like HicB family nuclease
MTSWMPSPAPPALKGHHVVAGSNAPGKFTIEEAKASILESMRLYIEECRASHRPIPRARTVCMETVSLAL